MQETTVYFTIAGVALWCTLRLARTARAYMADRADNRLKDHLNWSRHARRA